MRGGAEGKERTGPCTTWGGGTGWGGFRPGLKSVKGRKATHGCKPESK